MRADLAGVAHQVGEQLGLALGEPHREAVALDPPRQQVEPDAARLQRRRRLAARLAQVRPHPRRQLLEGEGLGHVVGGAAVEALDPLGDLALGGQHDHRQGRLRPPDRGQHLDPVAPGQHPVEDHQVDAAAEASRSPSTPSAAVSTVVALGLEAALEEVGDRRLVLDDQDLHAADASSQAGSR